MAKFFALRDDYSKSLIGTFLYSYVILIAILQKDLFAITPFDHAHGCAFFFASQSDLTLDPPLN